MADARSNATTAPTSSWLIAGSFAFAVIIAVVVSRAIARPLGRPATL
jgi:hypothetical protein